ncbi:MAG TPA: PKD domain-containing protein [Planctomycetota bacterium]
MQRFTPLVALVAVAAASTARAQFTLVTPNGYANTVGNSSNVFPWASNVVSTRAQFLIDSSHFIAQGVTTPIMIQQLRYRASPQPAASPISWAGGTWPSVRIDMATSPLDWAVASTTFASNLGPDRTTVLQGPVTVMPGTTTGVGGVVPWYITLPLTTPFVYDPTSGNDLTIDIRLDGTGWSGESRAADFVQGAPAAGPAGGSRVYSTMGLGATTGILSPAYVAVTEFTWVPAVNLLPRLSAAPHTPSVGQLVHFSDQTWTADPAGVTAWAWDVDGVPGIDYTTQHCAHTYTTEGPKSVTLTVTTAMFGTQSVTMTDYVVVDAVDVGFSASITPGSMLVAFTDRSAGSPTSWAWDFEDDGVVDSTAQNPVHTYPAGTTQSPCRLAVSDAFSSDTTTVNIGFGIVPVPVTGQPFLHALATRGFWFQAPTRFSITAARVPDPASNTVQNVAIFRLAAAPPTLPGVATGGLEFLASNMPIASPMPCVVSFEAGEYVGVLGACGTGGMTSVLAPVVGPYSSSVLGVPTTLSRFGMQFNINTQGADHPYWQEPAGQISSVILDVTACAAIRYGTGSPSGLGPAAPKMKATALPLLGQTAVHTVEQQDAFVLQVMVGGFGRASFPLPPFGTILIGSLDLLQIMNGGAPVGPGLTVWSFTLPNLASLVGTTVNFQNVNLELAAGAWSMSNGIEWVIGL